MNPSVAQWCAAKFLLLLLICCVYSITVVAPAQIVNQVRVYKKQRQMVLLYNEKIVKKYHISLGRNPTGHKQQEGDRKTPEGKYVIDFRNPQSGYHLALHISYPNEKDKESARVRGVSPGGDIMIHGYPNGYAWASFLFRKDWTYGCIAVTNEEIEEIWRLVPNGTPIHIYP